MAILDLKEKLEPYKKMATGYIKQMLSSKHVVMEDGTDLETKVTAYYLNSGGSWCASGTVIPLNDSYLNYKYIIIRTGWNSQNGGVRDNRLLIDNNTTTLYQVVPIYQATKYIGALVVEFNSSTPNQIKIVQSSGFGTSTVSANGIRQIIGEMKNHK